MIGRPSSVIFRLSELADRVNEFAQQDEEDDLIDVRMPHLNSVTPKSDQDRISPRNINNISNRQVMRIRKNVN